jgi:ComF family protein
MKPSRMIQGLLDLLFSPQCVICGETRGDGTGDGICHTCRSQIGYITSPLCHRCGLPFIPESGIDHFCQDCLQSSLFFGIARALGRYEGGLKEAITRFKYQEKITLGEHLGSIMVQGTYPGLSFSLYHVLMPVPLHPKRLRERGFNQAAVLASQLSRRYRIPLDLFSLRRIRPTESQIHLGFHERRKNVKGAFTLKDAEKVQRKNILVIDDVYTSGATVNECAKVLMKAGAARVDVLTLARAV